MPVEKEVKEVKEEKEPDIKQDTKEWLKAGRESATCSACGERLFRPSKPDNSTWRCKRYITNDQTPECQRGIPRKDVLDKNEVAAIAKKRMDKHKLEDIG